ncbi:Oidioi.mRNA.OKI2018_I69.PAR.g8836.t2.cds [Oikopleura dioica]|uniref:Oidioi.mRNA.OKI2018_I69.PAR.g8836.t2.cds n=1 Tax=Oikopleura dioica TaxID=34765 RepID=A0ABN7RLX0_OIKDI|nr:Oidioi.mRNA.OKI2018_I69.PAR.g8836.t2.cds [Oikopleura dioica]
MGDSVPFLVTLTNNGGYGFSLRGGQYISNVKNGSPAHQAGITTNHKLIEVNRISTETLTHGEIVELIRYTKTLFHDSSRFPLLLLKDFLSSTILLVISFQD